MFFEQQFINYEIKLRRLRRSILGAVMVMSLIGALLVYDASSIYAWHHYSDAMYFLKKQILFIALGFISMFLVLSLNLEYLKKYSRLGMIFGIVLLILVLFFGVRVGGAKRWFRFFGFGFQPSEFIKVLLLIYLADYFQRKRGNMQDFFKSILPVILITGVTCFLVLLAPDFGNAAFLGLILFIFLFISKMPRKYLVWFVVTGVVMLSVLIAFSPYRKARILSYINPWADAQGKGFQLVQSQIGLGSGGLLGEGLGESKQKLFFLPAAHTDFIFSIIGEEFGFLGSIGVVFFYLFVFFQGLRILQWINDPFSFLLGWGSLLIITLSALINIAVVVSVLPPKGLALPFISYGGSSTVVSFILVGLFLNATKTTETTETAQT